MTKRVLTPIESRQGALVTIRGKKYIDFTSNDYLGFSHHPAIKSLAMDHTQEFVGSTGSRLLSGDYTLFHELESAIAELKGKETALIFNSGYQMNTGIIRTMYRKGDLIIADKLCHASLIDGALFSDADLIRFRHNDINHLKQLLEKNLRHYNNILVITESVFSMDGDLAPIDAFISLKETYNCQLLIDEAHSTGIFGEYGEGRISKKQAPHIDYIVGTFGKALGSFGAYITCNHDVKDFLINTCRSFIYTTALPLSIIAANLRSIELLKEERKRKQKVLQHASHFRQTVSKFTNKVLGNSHIIPIVIGETDKTEHIADALQEQGFWVLPIRHPTVPQNEARLRFSITSDHTEQMIDNICEALESVL